MYFLFLFAGCQVVEQCGVVCWVCVCLGQTNRSNVSGPRKFISSDTQKTTRRARTCYTAYMYMYLVYLYFIFIMRKLLQLCGHGSTVHPQIGHVCLPKIVDNGEASSVLRAPGHSSPEHTSHAPCTTCIECFSLVDVAITEAVVWMTLYHLPTVKHKYKNRIRHPARGLAAR